MHSIKTFMTLVLPLLLSVSSASSAGQWDGSNVRDDIPVSTNIKESRICHDPDVNVNCAPVCDKTCDDEGKCGCFRGCSVDHHKLICGFAPDGLDKCVMYNDCCDGYVKKQKGSKKYHQICVSCIFPQTLLPYSATFRVVTRLILLNKFLDVSGI